MENVIADLCKVLAASHFEGGQTWSWRRRRPRRNQRRHNQLAPEGARRAWCSAVWLLGVPKQNCPNGPGQVSCFPPQNRTSRTALLLWLFEVLTVPMVSAPNCWKLDNIWLSTRRKVFVCGQNTNVAQVSLLAANPVALRLRCAFQDLGVVVPLKRRKLHPTQNSRAPCPQTFSKIYS